MLPDVSTAPEAPTAGEAALVEVAPDNPAVAPEAPGRRLPDWLTHATVIYVASRAITVVAMAVTTAFSHKTLLQEMGAWDGKWFLRAAAHGWPAHLPHAHGHVAANTIAFFPLFPLLIRWVSFATGLSLLGAGILVSAVTGWTATVAVWRLVRRFADAASADRATLLLVVFPGAFVLSMVYSEGLLLTLLALSLTMMMDRRWLAAGVLGALATFTSPVGLALVVPGAWCVVREIRSHRHWGSLAAPLLTPMGFVAYMAYLWQHTGDLAAWRATEAGGWRSTFSATWPFHVLASFVADPVAQNKTTDLLAAGIAVTVVLAVVAVRNRLPAPLLLYGLASAAFALCSMPVGLRPRFIFLAFPLVLALGIRVHGRAYGLMVAASALLMVGLAMFTAASYAIFP